MPGRMPECQPEEAQNRYQKECRQNATERIAKIMSEHMPAIIDARYTAREIVRISATERLRI